MSSLRHITLIWMALWLLVVMPGHKRGMVRLPASPSSQSCCSVTTATGPVTTLTTCCVLPGQSACDLPAPDRDPCKEQIKDPRQGPSGTPADDRDPAKDCTLCYLRGVMDLPAVVVFDLPAFLFAFAHHPPEHRVAVYPLATPSAAFARPPPFGVRIAAA